MLRHTLTRISAIVITTIGFSNLALALASDSPLASLKKTNGTITALLKKQAKAGSEDIAIRQKLTAAINSFLDFKELARLALGNHWATRTPREQQDFAQLLKKLIERSYLKQLQNNLNYQLDYKAEEIDGAIALVHTTAKVKANGAIQSVSIDYKMRKTNGSWMVFDVITDDVSIADNYRSQFNRIIRKQSYQALVDKMKNKLESI